MMSVLAGRPLIELAQVCYRADRPLMVIGSHGVGKSEILTQAADELKIGVRVFDLSVMEPPDLVGLPKIVQKRTVYCPPRSLPTTGKGFLIFEELNRAPTYMRAPCLQLLTARRVNEYALPAGWLPVAAVNPYEENYEVSEMDPALRSRFVEVNAVADRDQWLSWAQNNRVHPDVVSYFDSAPYRLRWDTGPHATREEAQRLKLLSPSFDVRATGLFVTCLRTLQDQGKSPQVGRAAGEIKRQRPHQRVGGVADLAQRDQRIFPPEAAPSGGPGTGG